MKNKSLSSKSGADKNKVIVKKYANRRLYNVTASQHLTHEELVDLIKRGTEVQVIDSKSKSDITQSVLMQIFLEEEKNGSHLFSSSFLHQLIRHRDGILEDFFTDVVPKLLEYYMEMKETMRRQISHIASPKHWISSTTKDLKIPNPFTRPEYLEDSEKIDEVDEVENLKSKIEDLEARLNKKEN